MLKTIKLLLECPSPVVIAKCNIQKKLLQKIVYIHLVFRYPLPSNAHFPLRPFAIIWGNGHRNLWYPVKALKVPLFPKRPNAHLPRCPYANIWRNGHRALGVAYSFPPNVHFPQKPICPKSPFTSNSPYAHLP